jgi:hypothetical protein
MYELSFRLPREILMLTNDEKSLPGRHSKEESCRTEITVAHQYIVRFHGF